MASRWRFLLAQFLWIALAIGILIGTNEAVPAAAIAPIVLMFLVTGFLMRWGDSHEQAGITDNTTIRAIVTGFMWLIYVGAIISGIMTVGAIAIPIAVIMMFPLLFMTAFMWDFFGKIRDIKLAEQGQILHETEKRKRDRLDTVLRDLSDEDLLRLKQRLSNRVVDEDIQYMLDDDGEIIPLKNNHRR